MFPFALILNPARFFQHIVSGNSIRQGLVVFAVAALSQVLAALVYSGRVVYEVVLGPYSPAEIRLFRFDYLLMSSLTTVFVTLVILVGIGRTVGRFLGKAQGFHNGCYVLVRDTGHGEYPLFWVGLWVSSRNLLCVGS